MLGLPRAELVRVLRRVPAAVDRARRVARSAALDEGTRAVLGDLWRFAVAGSMLVIDDEACVRCGHCASSCASVHGDGVSRLVVRGDKIAVHDATEGARARSSSRAAASTASTRRACIDCPTGAIGRDAHGSVFVREELCVGCGQCVSACPWGSVQMAPRAAAGVHVAHGIRRTPPDGKRRLPVAASAEVAVKCDLCSAVPSGPACVSACPVDAIARIDPAAAIAEVRQAVGARPAKRGLPVRRAAAPWIAAAVLVAMAAARVPRRAGRAADGRPACSQGCWSPRSSASPS